MWSTTLDALRITIERLCCEYPHLPPLSWLSGPPVAGTGVGLQSQRLNLAQHQEVLNLAA
jgi:hypothetical protein